MALKDIAGMTGAGMLLKNSAVGRAAQSLMDKDDDRARKKMLEKRIAEQRAAGAKMKKGGAVKASKRADGIAKKGKTKGKMR